MKLMKFLFKILFIVIGIYISICTLVYLFQEKIIFHPTKTAKEFQYSYNHKFDEVFLKTKDGIELHALYFQVENPKGVIYYLHGNSGNLEGWGDIANVYLENNFDVFILDYRGFGKSEGEINSEQQFFDDAQLGYDYLKKKYSEDEIVIIGYSIGTGTSAYLASENSPQQLILQAPYYSLSEVAKSQIPFVPVSLLLKYKFQTNKYISKVNCPITIFHGNEDLVINYKDNSKLKNHLKPTDQYITLNGQGHNGMNENSEYLNQLKILLNK